MAEHSLGQAHARGDAGCLSVSGVAPEGLELQRGTVITAHGPLADIVVVVAHALGCRAHGPGDGIESAGAQNAITGEGLEVSGARVLRQVSDSSGPPHDPRCWLGLPGEHAGKGRLAGTIATHEPDAVTRTHLQRRIQQE